MTSSDRRGRGLPLRTGLAWGFALAVVAAAVLLVRLAGGPPALLGVDQLAATPAAWLNAAGRLLPFGYAFAAGMLAALNPCGLALLPGYLGLYLGAADGDDSTAWRLRRGLGVALTMSGVFVLTFAAAGLVLEVVGASLATRIPWLGLLIGLLLAGIGAHLLSGGSAYTPLGDRAAARLAGPSRSGGLAGYAAYGLAYALASLGCTLPIFLTVVGLGAGLHDVTRSIGQLVLYGIGMAVVVTVLTLSLAIFKSALLFRVRKASQQLQRATGVILILVGAYVTAYWLTLGF